MSKALKIAGGIFVLILLVLVVCTFFGYRWVKGSLPKTKGEVILPDLRSDVRVYRDDFGVPHIFAEDERDLMYAAGFVAAQDRLWQMDLIRRACSGRLSEILGNAALESDKLLLTIGFKKTAKRIVEKLHPDSRQAMEAYTNGINEFIRQNKEKLSLEFKLLRYNPDDWTIDDIIAYSRIMAWQLNSAWKVELVLARLVDKLGEDRAQELFPDYPDDKPFIVPQKMMGFFLLWPTGFQTGSNSWVVSGGRSTSGRPILANDPHLELPAPSKWYEMHLVGGDYNVAGATLPGVPGVIIGHNSHIAWGLTNAMVDDTDFYIEKINPENPNQYLYEGRWEDMEIVNEVIPIKGEEPVDFEVRYTRHGPIISDILGSVRTTDQVMSMRWTGHDESDELHAVLMINRARNWDEFVDGLRYFKVPGQNFVYADRDGNIGYWCAAGIPIRKMGRGILPHPGWDGDYEWEGVVPFDELPHLLNPPENFIATANNRIVGDWYPYHISNLWYPPSRIERIRELLSEKEVFSLEDFKRVQNDYLSPHARSTVPYILEALDREGVYGAKMERIRDYLENWDFVEDKESVAASIFNVFYVKLIENIYSDETGQELYRDYVSVPSIPIMVTDRLLEKGESPWFDDVTTQGKVESSDDIIRKSIEEAVEFLTEELGDEPSEWKWEKLHTVTFAHFFGAKGPFAKVLNIGPFPVGGSNTTVNSGVYSFITPYRSVVGPSLRFIVDLAEIGSALTVITTGQSGQAASPHYQDQTELWLKGMYRTLVTDSTQIARSDWDLLWLRAEAAGIATTGFEPRD